MTNKTAPPTLLDNDCNSALHVAARDGYYGEVQQLLADGVDVNASNKNGAAALNFAVAQDEEQIVQLLIDHGADLEHRDRDTGSTPLLTTLMTGNNSRIARMLMDAGADTTVIDSDGYTVLHMAAYVDDAGIFIRFIKNGVDVNARNNKGDTPLKYCALFGAWKEARLLIHCGAAVDIADNNGDTALHTAILSANPDMAELLLNAGASTDVQNSQGKTPMHWADCYQDEKCKNLLIQHGASIPFSLPDFMTEQNLGTDSGTRARKKHWLDLPRLHTSVIQGRLERVENMLQSGEDVNSTDKYEYTPLHWIASAFRRSEHIAKLLIDYGADVNAQDRWGATPLHAVATSWKEERENESELAVILLAAGAELNAHNGNAGTPLYDAVTQGHSKLVQTLILKGADVRAPDQYGYTPLHRAVRNNDVDMVRLLLKHGADISRKDGRGWSPLNRAVSEKQDKLVKILEDKGPV